MWNRILFFACLWLCACSLVDPEIPEYVSPIDDPLPAVTIQSADKIFLREATLHITLTSESNHPLRRLYLCYSRELDQPDTTQMKIDLLPIYTEKTIHVNVTNLLPSTTYYCRVYAETRTDHCYSSSFKFRTSTSDSDIAWTEVTGFPNRKGFYNCVFTIGEDLYFQECETLNYSNRGGTAIWKFSPSAGSWEHITDFPGGKRIDPVVYVIKDKVYMGFGFAVQEDGQKQIKDDIWQYDCKERSWQLLPESPGGYSAVMSSFVYKDKGYLISTDAMWDEFPMYVKRFDPETGKWTPLSDFPGKKMNRTLTLVVDDRIFVVGGSFSYGSDPNYSNNLWEYVPDTDTWFRRADFPGSSRFEMRGFVIGNRMYAGFGYTNGYEDYIDYVNDLWEYIPSRDVWESRSAFTMWKPAELTFSVGTDQGGYLGSATLGLWMYSPEKDR